MTRIALRDLCGTRAGDKGDISNVALFAYSREAYDTIVREVTATRVKAHFGSMVRGDVVRYEAANLLGLNFVLYDVLAGGASRSLRADSQGKTLALALLHMPVERPENHAAMLRPAEGEVS